MPPTCADEQTDGSSSVISEDLGVPGPRDPAASSWMRTGGAWWCLPLALDQAVVLCSWDARGCGTRPVTCACVQKRWREHSAARKKGRGKMEGGKGIFKEEKLKENERQEPRNNHAFCWMLLSSSSTIVINLLFLRIKAM